MEQVEVIPCHLYTKDPIGRIEAEIKNADLKDPVQVEDLLPFDQMHYLGTEAIDHAIEKVAIQEGHHVLGNSK